MVACRAERRFREPELIRTLPSVRESAPSVSLASLDQLWFQVSGTVCNLRCRHCFISCSPENHSFWFLSREVVRGHLEASMGIGVKEYYFTGGEPFMNRDLLGILEDTLEIGPATVLTNGTILPARVVEGLRAIQDRSRYSLELRVSLDGVDRASNDAIRGSGSFERALAGIERLTAAGFLPIITTMMTWQEPETDRVLSTFRELLARVGYHRPRLKILPPLRIGAEVARDRGYEPAEAVTHDMMLDYPAELLLCSSARIVTSDGVWVCPILLDDPSGRVGVSLAEACSEPAHLSSPACYTCWTHGAICSNMPVGATP